VFAARCSDQGAVIRTEFMIPAKCSKMNAIFGSLVELDCVPGAARQLNGCGAPITSGSLGLKCGSPD